MCSSPDTDLLSPCLHRKSPEAKVTFAGPGGPNLSAWVVPAHSECHLTAGGAWLLLGTLTQRRMTSPLPAPALTSRWAPCPQPCLPCWPVTEGARATSSNTSFAGLGPRSCWTQRNCHSLSQLPPEERMCVRKTVTREYKYRRHTCTSINTTSFLLVVCCVSPEADMSLPRWVARPFPLPSGGRAEGPLQEPR